EQRPRERPFGGWNAYVLSEPDQHARHGRVVELADLGDQEILGGRHVRVEVVERLFDLFGERATWFALLHAKTARLDAASDQMRAEIDHGARVSLRVVEVHLPARVAEHEARQRGGAADGIARESV